MENHRNSLEKIMEERSAAVWKAWSAQAAKLTKDWQKILQDGQAEHYYN